MSKDEVWENRFIIRYSMFDIPLFEPGVSFNLVEVHLPGSHP